MSGPLRLDPRSNLAHCDTCHADQVLPADATPDEYADAVEAFVAAHHHDDEPTSLRHPISTAQAWRRHLEEQP